MKTTYVQLRMTEELKEKAKQRAKENYQNLTEYITSLIVKDLKENK